MEDTMSRRLCVLLVLFFCGFIGCSEVSTTVERASTVDVVGDPNESVADSTEVSDIFGSGDLASNETESIVEARSVTDKSPTRTNEPAEVTDSVEEPDVAGGSGTAKPVSLKKKQIPVSQTKP